VRSSRARLRAKTAACACHPRCERRCGAYDPGVSVVPGPEAAVAVSRRRELKDREAILDREALRGHGPNRTAFQPRPTPEGAARGLHRSDRTLIGPRGPSAGGVCAETRGSTSALPLGSKRRSCAFCESDRSPCELVTFTLPSGRPRRARSVGLGEEVSWVEERAGLDVEEVGGTQTLVTVGFFVSRLSASIVSGTAGFSPRESLPS
jgi:hypothetical protein